MKTLSSQRGKAQNQTPNLRKYAARTAAGSQIGSACGHVGTAAIPSIFTTDAERIGTRSKPAGYAPVARINGYGPPACNAAAGQSMKTGILKLAASGRDKYKKGKPNDDGLPFFLYGRYLDGIAVSAPVPHVAVR